MVEAAGLEQRSGGAGGAARKLENYSTNGFLHIARQSSWHIESFRRDRSGRVTMETRAMIYTPSSHRVTNFQRVSSVAGVYY